MEPKASIIITTWNRCKILQERALKSALNQTFLDKEIIVVDHGSTDDTEEEMKRYLKFPYHHVRYLKLPQNSGIVSTARNAGIKIARGKYVVFLDDDNELHPEYLKKTVEFLDSRTQYEAVFTSRIIKYKDYQDIATPPFAEKIVSIDWGWLIRKWVFDEIQYDEKCMANEDTDFGIQFLKVFRYGQIHEPLQTAYDTDDPKSSHSYPSPIKLSGWEYFLNKNLETYNNPNELRYIYRLVGRSFYWGGFKLKGLRYMWKSFRAMPQWRSFKHFFFLLWGWKVYEWYMNNQERK